LFDLLVEKIKNNSININVLSSLFKNVPENILQTVKQYIIMNQSVINTSEAMFTHRNTINYRLNKFIELTGINVRETSSAMTTYLLLTLLNK
jgi:sugar diacid utilization regulator